MVFTIYFTYTYRYKIRTYTWGNGFVFIKKSFCTWCFRLGAILFNVTNDNKVDKCIDIRTFPQIIDEV